MCVKLSSIITGDAYSIYEMDSIELQEGMQGENLHSTCTPFCLL